MLLTLQDRLCDVESRSLPCYFSVGSFTQHMICSRNQKVEPGSTLDT